MTEKQGLVLAHQDAKTDDADVHAHVAREFEHAVRGVVRDLRALADRVEQVSAPGPDKEAPGFGVTAASLIADIMNALPNLGLSAVTRAAAQADTALLRSRLGKAVHEAEILRANPGLTPVESDAAAAGEPIAVGANVVHVDAGDEPDPDDFGVVTSIQQGGYAVQWTGSCRSFFAAADEVVLATDQPETYTRA